jgi:hypothetical protein
MISKAKLIEQIDKFPNELSIDDLIDRLVFIDKLEQRIQESNENEVISEKEMEVEMKSWFK